MDPRVKKLATLLLNYSLKIKKGQWLKIQGEIVALPLITATYEEAIRLGANPYVEIVLPETREAMIKNGSDDQLKFISPSLKVEINKVDAILTIWGTENTRFMAGTNPKRQAIMQSARKRLGDKMFSRIGDGSLSWVGTQFPTNADAQEADMSLSDYREFVFRAGHLHAADPVKHWKKVEKEQKRLKRILDRVDRIHVQAGETDLKMRVKGRKWISCHGTENFPDGEIFTAPIENSVEGRIKFSYPSVYAGREVVGVTLDFKAGKVVAESADKNLDYLVEMLNIDAGARRVGEFAIGTNYEIKRFSRNTLFDEKIGGTCHLAVGASFSESGGKNKSAIHWDLVTDLKKGGRITADGKVIYSNGKFVI